MTTSVPPAVFGWRRVAAGVAHAGALALLAVTLGACAAEEDPDEGTNGVGRLAPEEIEERALAAARGASAVRVSGTVTGDGQTYRLDVRLGEDGCVGEVSTEGMTFELLRLGEDLYIQADEAFWESGGIPEELESDPAEKLDGKYVRVAPEDPAYEQLAGFTEMDVLLDGLLALEGERQTGDRGEVADVRTIRVTAAGGRGGSMDVALVGEPYPLRVQRGGGAGELLMDDWDQDFELHAPPEEEIVDYGDEMVE